MATTSSTTTSYKEGEYNERLQEIFENVGCEWESLAQSLLSWMDDDEVGRFAEANGWFDED